MKITDIRKVEVEIIETDEDTYRRSGSGGWEVLMGCSWEMVGSEDELEKMYQEYRELQLK
jgi:hypothetical protein